MATYFYNLIPSLPSTSLSFTPPAHPPSTHSQAARRPHTQADKRTKQTDAHAHALTLHLCLICYHIPGHCTVSLPLAIHFMLTQHQSVALPSHSSTSIHRRAAYHSHLQGKQTMFVSIPPRRLDPLRRIAPADADARHAAAGLLTLSSGNVSTSAIYLSLRGPRKPTLSYCF